MHIDTHTKQQMSREQIEVTELLWDCIANKNSVFHFIYLGLKEEWDNAAKQAKRQGIPMPPERIFFFHSNTRQELSNKLYKLAEKYVYFTNTSSLLSKSLGNIAKQIFLRQMFDMPCITDAIMENFVYRKEQKRKENFRDTVGKAGGYS